jgi:acyl dehydratase
MSTVELLEPPKLGGLYRRAALGVFERRTARSLPETTLVLRGVTVDREDLAEYDRVCGFRLSDALAPTYPHVLAFPIAMRLMSGPDFPFPVVGLVHVANRITQARPVEAGEQLDFAVHAENLRPHERGRQLDVVAVATVDGHEVWRGVSTYLRREKDGAGRERSERREPPTPSAVWPVPPSVGTEYARVSGDRNPIHTSRLGARLFGFPRPIAHGMWSKARCLAQLAGRLPEAFTVDVGFKLPILLPATVAFSVQYPAGTGWSFALHDARSGRPHLSGTVTG